LTLPVKTSAMARPPARLPGIPRLNDSLDLVAPRHRHRIAGFQHNHGVGVGGRDRIDDCVLAPRQGKVGQVEGFTLDPDPERDDFAHRRRGVWLLRFWNPFGQHGFNLPDVALIQSPQLAQLTACVAPELIAARRVVEFVLRDSGEPADDAERGLAFDQGALAQDCFQP
jgi:hypothetical protein